MAKNDESSIKNPITPCTSNINTTNDDISSDNKCPTPLSKRNNDGKLDIDWTFISKREGGQKIEGYVPASEVSNSGVTIATGVDLGARNESDIDNLKIDEELKTKLKPYVGKQGKDAVDYLQKKPLNLSESQAASLDKAVKKPLIDKLVQYYDTEVDKLNKADNCERVHFEKLPNNVQTAITSISFQYGSLSTATPNFWKQITEQRWEDARANLKDFGDDYPTRRKLEAGLIEEAIKASVSNTK
ncbi:toxin homologue of phage lysozyme [Desulfomicrobium apsheronum]|uniref:Toxin homologue of phage lysozyme n=1 Tax=Desulfomicrobium apsheronum TaxID=52560 RepID=A0A1I3ZEQ6_9BACT|nr:pesticin C-terminus-like muramidase [Desulfomicrobium apsheronum]SFK42201.1 toxin homologue of phage lysozyme [Desulfomicrobium apsheronum]